MYGVVNEGAAPVCGRDCPDIEVCGKTGTAQLASNEFVKQRAGKADEGQRLVRWVSRRDGARKSWWSRCLKHGEHGYFAAAHRARCDQGLFRQESAAGAAACVSGRCHPPAPHGAAASPGPAAPSTRSRHRSANERATLTCPLSLPRDLDWTLLVITLVICAAWAFCRFTAPRSTPSCTTPGGSRSSTWSAACC